MYIERYWLPDAIAIGQMDLWTVEKETERAGADETIAIACPINGLNGLKVHSLAYLGSQ